MAETAMLGLAFGGSAIQAIGSARAGSAQQKVSYAQAAQAEEDANQADQNAALEREAGDQKVRQVQREGDQLVGSIRTAYGASGVTLDGTPSSYIENAQAFVKDNAINVKYQAFMQSEAFKKQAARYRTQAGIYRAGGDDAGSAGLIGVGAAAAQGFGGLIGRVYEPNKDPYSGGRSLRRTS